MKQITQVNRFFWDGEGSPVDNPNVPIGAFYINRAGGSVWRKLVTGWVDQNDGLILAEDIVDSTPASRAMLTGPESSVPLLRLDLTTLTGGGPTALDGIATTTLTPPRALFLIRPNEPLACYQLEAGTTAESVPNIIRPDDFHAVTNAKIWVRKL
jgi:hypothetical protein